MLGRHLIETEKLAEGRHLAVGGYCLEPGPAGRWFTITRISRKMLPKFFNIFYKNKNKCMLLILSCFVFIFYMKNVIKIGIITSFSLNEFLSWGNHNW